MYARKDPRFFGLETERSSSAVGGGGATGKRSAGEIAGRAGDGKKPALDNDSSQARGSETAPILHVAGAAHAPAERRADQDGEASSSETSLKRAKTEGDLSQQDRPRPDILYRVPSLPQEDSVE